MASVTVILYRPVIEYMASWSGDIGRSVMQLGRRIELVQKHYAPRKTGRLHASISIDRGRWAGGIEMQVGANPAGGAGPIGVALWQELGTRPHEIRPRNPAGVLVFYWPRVGQVVRLTKVNHPGHRGRHWAELGMQVGFASW